MKPDAALERPFVTPALREETVNKMVVKVRGAPFEDAEIRAILAYLDANYVTPAQA